MIWLGLDIGDVRIGIALSDERGKIAFPRETYQRGTRKEDERYLASLIEEEGVAGILYGLARHMNHDFSEQAEKNQKVITGLKKRLDHTLECSIQYVAWDERMSSLQAERSLLMQDMGRKKRKEHIDAVAASIILQSFLDQQGE